MKIRKPFVAVALAIVVLSFAASAAGVTGLFCRKCKCQSTTPTCPGH
jgi:hypothetical protein